MCEPSYLVGEVLTCVCPNPRLVLTAGTSSVVCVWVYHKVSAVLYWFAIVAFMNRTMLNLNSHYRNRSSSS